VVLRGGIRDRGWLKGMGHYTQIKSVVISLDEGPTGLFYSIAKIDAGPPLMA
jgi:hypothetical protein